METPELSQPGYWDSLVPDLRFNPVGSPDQDGLLDFARSTEALAGHVLVATSGTRSVPRWIAVSRRAILASARAVNEHLAATEGDRWLLALPPFHVGGLGVFARAHLAGSRVSVFEGKWRGRAREFARQCDVDEITLTALTPTQVFDLVQEAIPAPPCLRAIVVGGGGLANEVGREARELGWPVLQSYGMTEACSQIATEPLEALRESYSGDWLPVLPHWELRTEEDGRLAIRGGALFTGMVEKDSIGNWEFAPAPLDGDGFFSTSDRAELRETEEGRSIRFLGRCDDLVKILGELISLNELREKFSRIVRSEKRSATLLALSDSRSDHRLLAVLEGEAISRETRERILSEYHADVAPFERIAEWVVVPELPRTAIGKIAYGRLRQQITSVLRDRESGKAGSPDRDSDRTRDRSPGLG